MTAALIPSVGELMRRFDAFAESHPVADWIALSLIVFGLVCLSVADWRRTSHNRPRPRP